MYNLTQCSMANLDYIFDAVNKDKNKIVNSLINICSIPAIAPESKGDGEKKKVDAIIKIANKLGLTDVKLFSVPDKRVSCGYRPSLLINAHIIDNKKPTLYILTHSDVVPAGDLIAWKGTKPFKPVVKKVQGKEAVIGRGVKDNGQQLIASLYGVAIAKKYKLLPKKYNIKLLIVADEETGSKYGIDAIVNKLGLKRNDLFVVPDAGNEDGSQLEVCEKSILWLEFVVEGKQCHASLPGLGRNAAKAAMYLGVELDKQLHKLFDKKNTLFVWESQSTFEITKINANVENVNTIPGRQIFCMDCRINPEYNITDVKKKVNEIIAKIENDFGVKIKMNIIWEDSTTLLTSVDAPVVKLFSKALKIVYPKITPKAEGIGGGTFGSILRKKGFDVLVWGHGPGTDHSPREYCFVDNLINDAKVYVALVYLLGDN